MKKRILALFSAITIALAIAPALAQTTSPQCARLQARLARAQHTYTSAQTRLANLQTRLSTYQDKGIQRTSTLTARAEFSEGMLKATQEQVVKQGYGCLLQPNPCVLPSSLGIRDELRRAQIRSVARRGQLDRWTKEYARSVTTQNSRIQKQQARVAQTAADFAAAERAAKTCSVR